MPGPSLLNYVKLLKDAQAGNPIARAALPAAREEAFPSNESMEINPPPGEPLPAKPMLPEGPAMLPGMEDPNKPMSVDRGVAQQTLPSARPTGPQSATALHAPMSPGQPVGGGGFRGFLGSHPEIGEGIGNLVGHLAGAGLAKAFGGENAVDQWSQGFGETAISGMQARQLDDMRRRQKVWEDAYNQAQQIPQEALMDPQFAELAQAHQALMKDLKDNRIDNQDNVGNFMVMMSKYKDDLSRIGAEKEAQIRRDIEMKDMQQKALVNDQLAQQYRRIVDEAAKGNPAGYPPEVIQNAQQKVFELDMSRKEYEMKMQQWDEERKHRQFTENATTQELGMRGRSLGLQERRLGQVDQQKGAASLSSSLTGQLRQRLSQGLEAWKGGLDQSTPFNPEAETDAFIAANKDTIVANTGMQILMPGIDQVARPTVLIGGKQLPLDVAPNTPPEEIKRRALRMAFQAIQAQGQLGLYSAYGGGGEF